MPLGDTPVITRQLAMPLWLWNALKAVAEQEHSTPEKIMLRMLRRECRLWAVQHASIEYMEEILHGEVE